MSAVNQTNLPTHHRGDTWDGLVGSLTYESNDSAVSFTGATVLMEVRTKPKREGDLVKRWATGGQGITIAEDGESFAVEGEIIDWPPATYFYEIEVTYADGSVRTAWKGSWTIGEDLATGED